MGWAGTGDEELRKLFPVVCNMVMLASLLMLGSTMSSNFGER